MSQIGSEAASAAQGAVIAAPTGETIADTINELHEQGGRRAVALVEDAVRCGQLLTEQKASLSHGEFKPWVEANINFSHRTVTNYMRAAKKAKEQGLPFSTLQQLYGPEQEDDTTEKSVEDAQRDTAPPPSQLDAEVIELNAALEKMQLPLMSAEAFVGKVGRDPMTEKAYERIEWLVALNDTLCNLEELPQ